MRAPTGPASESRVQSLVRLEAASKGVYLFRNNVGAGHLKNGNYIRWGLANDSTQVNKRLKSADLIGGRPRIITPDMVGSVILQFLSRECKREGYVPPSPEAEAYEDYEAQLRWRDLIRSLGGDAEIVSGVGSL